MCTRTYGWCWAGKYLPVRRLWNPFCLSALLRLVVLGLLGSTVPYGDNDLQHVDFWATGSRGQWMVDAPGHHRTFCGWGGFPRQPFPRALAQL